MTSLCGSVRRCETAISGVLLCSFFIGFRDFFWHEGQGQLLRKQTFRYPEHSWRFATFDIYYQILSYTILVSWCYPFPVPGLMRHGMDYTTIKPMTCSSLATMWTHIMVSNWKYLKMTLFQVGEHIMTQPGPCIPVLFLFYREIHQNYRELRFDFRKGFFSRPRRNLLSNMSDRCLFPCFPCVSPVQKRSPASGGWCLWRRIPCWMPWNSQYAPAPFWASDLIVLPHWKND